MILKILITDVRLFICILYTYVHNTEQLYGIYFLNKTLKFVFFLLYICMLKEFHKSIKILILHKF